LLCSLAIAGAPPFPIFLSEFSILSAGLRSGHSAAVIILSILIVIAFIAIFLQVNSMLFGEPLPVATPVLAPRSCRTAILIAVAPVLLFGVYIPGPVHSLMTLAAQQLGGH
jgi:hydrogenase-4 component F